MLNEDILKALADPIAYRLQRLNADVLYKLGKRINQIGKLKASDMHRLEQLVDYGADVDEILRALDSITEKNIEDINNMFEIAASQNYKFAEKFYNMKGIKYIPYIENVALKRYVAAMAKQTADTYKNMSRTTGFMMYDTKGNKVFTSLSQTYYDVIDRAVTAVSTGVDDYQSAMRQTLRRLADSGLQTKYKPLEGSAGKVVDYATGYSRRLDTAVRQNILWGAKQCAQGVAEMTGKEFGADGYEVDYHTNPRPSHAAMSGKMYAAGKGRTVNGQYYPSISEVQHLLDDYGCLHFKTPVLLGISEPSYTKRQLEALQRRDEKKIKYEGKKYTGYEATQVQRKLETAARHAKDRQLIAKSAGDDVLRREEQAKLNAITNQYKKFSDVMGLPTKLERMSVGGYYKVKTQAQLWTTEIKGTVTSNGISVTDVSQHFYDQAKNRGIINLVTKDNIVNTLTEPLNIGKIKTDTKGRSSQQFLGEKLTIGINNDTGVLVTVWKTGSDKISKYIGGGKT